jgi:hypothetical protein
MLWAFMLTAKHTIFAFLPCSLSQLLILIYLIVTKNFLPRKLSMWLAARVLNQFRVPKMQYLAFEELCKALLFKYGL